MTNGIDGVEATAGSSFMGSDNEVMDSIFSMAFGEETEEVPGDPGGAGAPAQGDSGETEPHSAPTGEPSADGGAAAAGTPGTDPSTGLPSTPAEPVRAPVDTVWATEFTRVGEALEERFTNHYRQEVLAETEEVYSQYVERLQLHPLELVGKPLPPLSADGNDITFSTAAEVREWQDAVKSVLRREIEGKIESLREQDEEVLSVVHSSIAMFQNNTDLIPKTAGFNKQLATTVSQLLKPYELRMDGKLTGYSIDTQGIIDQARGQLKSAAPAAAAAPAKKAAAKKAAPPQAGLSSRAGTSGAGGEDYAPMWNALGIDTVPI